MRRKLEDSTWNTLAERIYKKKTVKGKGRKKALIHIKLKNAHIFIFTCSSISSKKT